MKNLLKSEYARMFRSSAFRSTAIFVPAMFLLTFCLRDYWIYTDLPLSERAVFNNDSSLFSNTMSLMVLIPLFISSFIGAELLSVQSIELFRRRDDISYDSLICHCIWIKNLFA